jgi:hypothetical protein
VLSSTTPSEPNSRTVWWSSSLNGDAGTTGLERLTLSEGLADSTLLAADPEFGPFQLNYRLAWDASWRITRADLRVTTAGPPRWLRLTADGDGRWTDETGGRIASLDGCVELDIFPTPFTNTFPVRRQAMKVGERRQFRMAWILAPQLTVSPQEQAYTRLAERLYLFESLDGSGFRAELTVDEDGLVLDYPGLFRRVVSGPVARQE